MKVLDRNKNLHLRFLRSLDHEPVICDERKIHALFPGEDSSLRASLPHMEIMISGVSFGHLHQILVSKHEQEISLLLSKHCGPLHIRLLPPWVPPLGLPPVSLD
jgi:hypothetical protein